MNLNPTIFLNEADSITSAESEDTSKNQSIENEQEKTLNNESKRILQRMDSKIIHHEHIEKSRKKTDQEPFDTICNKINVLSLENESESMCEKSFQIEILINQPTSAKDDCGLMEEVEIDLVEKLNQTECKEEADYYIKCNSLHIAEIKKLGIPIRNDSYDSTSGFESKQQQTKF